MIRWPEPPEWLGRSFRYHDLSETTREHYRDRMRAAVDVLTPDT